MTYGKLGDISDIKTLTLWLASLMQMGVEKWTLLNFSVLWEISRIILMTRVILMRNLLKRREFIR